MTLLRPPDLVPSEIFLDGDASHFVDGTGQMSVPAGTAQPAGSTELAYAEFTSGVVISATTEGTANTVVTAGAITADGTSAVIIEFYSPEVGFTSGAATLNVWLYEDGSSIGRVGQADFTAASQGMPFCARRKMTPASGSRTYSIRASRVTTNVTVNGGAGGAGNELPGFIRITS